MFCFVGNPKDAPRPGILDTALFFFALEACHWSYWSAVIPFVVYFFVTKSYQFTFHHHIVLKRRAYFPPEIHGIQRFKLRADGCFPLYWLHLWWKRPGVVEIYGGFSQCSLSTFTGDLFSADHLQPGVGGLKGNTGITQISQRSVCPNMIPQILCHYAIYE